MALRSTLCSEKTRTVLYISDTKYTSLRYHYCGQITKTESKLDQKTVTILNDASTKKGKEMPDSYHTIITLVPTVCEKGYYSERHYQDDFLSIYSLWHDFLCMDSLWHSPTHDIDQWYSEQGFFCLFVSMLEIKPTIRYTIQPEICGHLNITSKWCSLGLGPGLCTGQWSSSTPTLANHVFTDLVALSCWNRLALCPVVPVKGNSNDKSIQKAS